MQPFKLADPAQRELLIQVALRNQQDALAGEVIQRLQRVLPDWEIFLHDDEESFEKEIGKLVHDLSDEILRKCKNLDTAQKEFIMLEDFHDILEQLNI